MLRFSFSSFSPLPRTSLHHQPEAQHPKSSATHNIAGRLPHLSGVERTWPARSLHRHYAPSSNIGAGDMGALCKEKLTTANPPTRRYTTPAFPATRPSKLATSSSTRFCRETMVKVTYNKQLTTLLVIDPYNDFISEGGKLWGRIRAVAEANDCVPHMLQVLNAARKAKFRVFYALHHRYR